MEGITLWPHQEEAVAFGEGRDTLFLDMAMGTGKSLVTIELLDRWQAKKVLVICPLSVLGVWRREFFRWNPDRDVLVLDQRMGVARKAKAVAEFKPHSSAVAVVVNYDSAWRGNLGQLLHNIQWDAVILDESHMIGGHNTARSKWCHNLRARRKVCLSGTPMDNPLHLWSQFRFLNPGVFGYRFHAYRIRYAKLKNIPGIAVPIVTGWQNLEELQEKFRQHAYHAPASLLNLLPTRHIDIHVGLDRHSQQVYDDMNKHFIAELDSGVITTAANALTRLLRLQQIASGYVSVEEEVPQQVHGKKQEALCELLEGMSREAQVVVFGIFNTDLKQAEEAAEKCGRPYRELSGSIKTALNEHGQLNDIPGQVVGVNIRAGGLGVDLTRAQYGVYFSVGFSLRDYQQSLARLDRPGQEKHVTFYHLIARGTVDEQVAKALEAKAEIADFVLGSHYHTKNKYRLASPHQQNHIQAAAAGQAGEEEDKE